MSSEISTFKRLRRDKALFRKAMLLMAVAPVAGLATQTHAAAIFTDDFSNGSTLQGTSTPGGTPTASYTSYDIAGAKNQTAGFPTINSGSLSFSIAASTGAIEEIQAIFTGSPVTLTNVGDALDYQVVFTNTTGVLTAGTGAQIDFGLYSSGGSAPLTTLENSGLASGTSSGATGGAQNWLGYVSQIFITGGTSKIVTRPAQSGTSNTNQDVIGNDASASQAYDNPPGTTLISGSTGQTATLSNGSQYTEDMNISLTAPSTYTITTNLYAGATASGTALATQTATGVTSPNFYNGFDALAIGYRETGNVVSELTVNSIAITGPSVPEPASLSLLGLGAAATLSRRRKRRNSR